MNWPLKAGEKIPQDLPGSSFVQKLFVLSLFLIGGYLIYLLLPIISILFLAAFLTILFSPFLRAMKRFKIPDWLGIILIFSLFLLFFLIAFFAIVPIFIQQLTLLFSNATTFFSWLEKTYQLSGINSIGLPIWAMEYLQSIDLGTLLEFLRSHASSLTTIATGSASQIASGSANIVSSLSGGIFQFILTLIFTFFMTLERTTIYETILEILPSNTKSYIISREKKITQVLTSWLKGQILLGLSIFILTLLWLLSLRFFGIHIEWIFILAFIAGLMEFIPYIGPFLALLPALAVAAGMGLSPIFAIIVLYIVIQQTENNILVPMVMSKTLDLSPFLILVTMTAGASLFGIIGILLAIPFAAILRIGVVDFITWKRKFKKLHN